MEYKKSDENFSALNENLKILKKSRNHLGKQNTIVENSNALTINY